jgi:hypothetical protein
LIFAIQNFLAHQLYHFVFFFFKFRFGPPAPNLGQQLDKIETHQVSHLLPNPLANKTESPQQPLVARHRRRSVLFFPKPQRSKLSPFKDPISKTSPLSDVLEQQQPHRPPLRPPAVVPTRHPRIQQQPPRLHLRPLRDRRRPLR